MSQENFKIRHGLSVSGVEVIDASGNISATSLTIDGSTVSADENLSITESQISDLQSYLTSETVTSLSLNANTLTFTDENGSDTNIDLSAFLDDTTNTVVSASLVGTTITFTREDTTTFQLDVTDLYDDTNLVTSVAGRTGAVTLTESDITDFGTYLENVNGESIKDLSDVYSSMSPSDGQLLTYDTTNGWQAEDAPASYNDSSVDIHLGGLGYENTETALEVSLAHTLDNPNVYGTSVSDFFGQQVAVSGDYVVVGVSAEDDASGSSAGTVYIYNTSTGSLLYTIADPNPYSTPAFDSFGCSVSVSGDYTIIGAYGEGDPYHTGNAYIFNVTTGSLVHTLDNPNAYGTADNDNFGRYVSISGNYAIVAASGEDDSGGSSSGKAYIFNVTTGSLVHTLDNPNAYGTSDSDYFYSVGISGNYAVVGAKGEDDAGGSASGKAYVFDVTTGSLLYTLDNPNAYDTPENDNFGSMVCISDRYIVVGVSAEDDSGGTSSGKAYIFDVTTGSLLHTLDNPNAYSTTGADYFGGNVAISGNFVIVGATGEDGITGTGSGIVYIFDARSGSLVDTLENPNAYSTGTNDYFSWGLSATDNYIAVGAFQEDDAEGSSSGKVYIYDKSVPEITHTFTGTIVADAININNLTEIKTSNYSASVNDFILCNTDSASFTITLPASPTTGDKITIQDVSTSFGTNSLILGRNGNTIMGLSEDMNLDVDDLRYDLLYISGDWRISQ